MLTLDALHAGVPLSQLAFTKKTTLTPVPNTPLAVLVGSTSLPEPGEVMVDQMDGMGPQVDLDIIASRTNSAFPNTDYVAHDRAFDEVVQVAAETIRKQVSFARTVVSPIIQEIVEKTKAALSSGQVSKIANYRVEPFNYPNVIFNNAFESMIANAVGTNQKFDMLPIVSFPVISTEDVAKLLETGAKNIDKDVADWIAIVGPDFLDRVWRNFFSVEKDLMASQTMLRGSFNRTAANSFEASGYDYAVAVYLIASRLSEEPLAGSNMGANDLESALKGYREIAAGVLTNAMNEADNAMKNGVLVRSRNEYTVSVNNHVYVEWLKDEQNCAEVLLGLLLENRTMIFADDIAQNRDRLYDNWERHVRLVRASEQAEEHVEIRRLFVNYFNQHFKAEITERPEYAQQIMTACKNFELELMKFTSDEMRSLWLPATKAVCRAAYPVSNAEEILVGMEDAARSNPEADPRELAAIVVVEMASRWVAQQIQVTG